MKLPIEQISEAIASREVRAGLLTGWLGAGGGGGEVARAASVAARGAPSEVAATATGATAGAAGTMKLFWQAGQLIWVPP